MGRLLVSVASVIAGEDRGRPGGDADAAGATILPLPRRAAAPLPQASLSLNECWQRLSEVRVGRIVYDDIDGPVMLPVNHLVDGESIVVRIAPTSRMALLARDARVAYEADDVAPDGSASWSVLVRGRAEFLSTPLPPGPHARPTPAVAGDRAQFVRIVPRGVTGRRLVGA